MSAVEKIKGSVKEVVGELVSHLSEDEKRKVLDWSERALVIRSNSSLSRKEMVEAFARLENSEIAQVVFSKIFSALKSKVWTNQSWARRLGFVGLASGLSFGGAAVGVATMGAGIGIPLMLMTAAGGVVLGAAIDEIKKEI